MRLEEAQRHIDVEPRCDGYICSPQSLRGAWILNVSVIDPGEHLFAWLKHLLSAGVQVGKDFNGNAGIADERRNLLDNFSVFLILFFFRQLGLVGPKQ